MLLLLLLPLAFIGFLGWSVNQTVVKDSPETEMSIAPADTNIYIDQVERKNREIQQIQDSLAARNQDYDSVLKANQELNNIVAAKNAQIFFLKGEISKLKVQVDSLFTENGRLKNKLAELGQSIVTRASDVTAAVSKYILGEKGKNAILENGEQEITAIVRQGHHVEMKNENGRYIITAGSAKMDLYACAKFSGLELNDTVKYEAVFTLYAPNRKEVSNQTQTTYVTVKQGETGAFVCFKGINVPNFGQRATEYQLECTANGIKVGNTLYIKVKPKGVKGLFPKPTEEDPNPENSQDSLASGKGFYQQFLKALPFVN